MKESNDVAKVEMVIRKPVEVVFEAFLNPEITTKFWFSHSSGKLEEGKRINWTWEMYDLTTPVFVKEVVPNQKILVEWGEGKLKSSVKWEFDKVDQNSTFLSITNFDFQSSGDELVSRVIDSKGGFTSVVAGLKAWLEHNVQLNLVADKSA